MPRFESPAIHKAHSIRASITKCNEGKDTEFACLTVSIRGAGSDAEVEIYFNLPHHENAQKYADAINAVQS